MVSGFCSKPSEAMSSTNEGSWLEEDIGEDEEVKKKEKEKRDGVEWAL